MEGFDSISRVFLTVTRRYQKFCLENLRAGYRTELLRSRINDNKFS